MSAILELSLAGTGLTGSPFDSAVAAVPPDSLLEDPRQVAGGSGVLDSNGITLMSAEQRIDRIDPDRSHGTLPVRIGEHGNLDCRLRPSASHVNMTCCASLAGFPSTAKYTEPITFTSLDAPDISNARKPTFEAFSLVWKAS